MAAGKNSFVRVLVPLAILVGIGYLVWTGLSRGSGSNTPAPQPTPPTQPQATPTQPAALPGAADKPATPPGNTPATTPPAATPPNTPAATPPTQPAGPALTGLKTRDAIGKTSGFTSLGSTDPKSPFMMKVEFSDNGTGIANLSLSRHTDGVGKDAKPEVLQKIERYSAKGSPETLAHEPFMALGLFVDGALVDLRGTARVGELRRPAWEEIAAETTADVQSVTFRAVIIDSNNAEVAHVLRTYRLFKDRYDLELEQKVVNLTSARRTYQFVYYGPNDLPKGIVRYAGDPRRLRIGELPPVDINPDLQVVFGSDVLIPHAEVAGQPTGYNAYGTPAWPDKVIWPNEHSVAGRMTLSWIAQTNRYFGVGIFPLFDKQPKRSSGLPDKSLHADTIDRQVLYQDSANTTEMAQNAISTLRIRTLSVVTEPNAAADFSVGVYAGPLSKKTLASVERTQTVSMDGLVVFTFGGPCAFCTFQPVARFLRGFLGILHDYVTFDWSLAIVMLVVCVRTALHPITKWSQTNLQRFSKKMASLAPKQKKLQEKYGSDQKKLREEMANLMREENVNFAGALGCLPLFLQTPIWIALSAMVYYTMELRHTPALFGAVQAAAPDWHFLADLSEPDKFISFGTSFSIPLLSGLIGKVESFNLLPLLMGVLFFAQQKYLTPPPTGEISPEMQTQQKIMKVMIVVLFPLMMYNAPSGLVIYFLANSGLGILESQMIRRQVEAMDKAEEEYRKQVKEGKAPPPPPRRPGFFERLRIMAEQKQKELEARKKASDKGKDNRFGPR